MYIRIGMSWMLYIGCVLISIIVSMTKQLIISEKMIYLYVENLSLHVVVFVAQKRGVKQQGDRFDVMCLITQW